MFKKFVFIVFLALGTTLQAQEAFHKSYDWETNPSYTVNNPDAGLVAIKEKIVSEFIFEGEGLYEYFLEHRVIYLNSDDAIERYNKVYLPYTGTTNLEANKARVIKKTGEILELDESKILTADDEETGRKYKYFAFEGIEKGSFIEYYYIQKRNPRYTGSRLSFQGENEVQNVAFDLYSPSNLIFEFKSLNGLPEIQKDSNSTEKNHWSLRVKNLKPLEKEPNSAYESRRGAILYKMSKNTYNNTLITTYDKVAQNLYSIYYPKYDKKVQKEIDKFASEIGIAEDMDEDTKIRKIDIFIKTNVFNSEIRNEALEDLETVLKNRGANETGLVKLFVAMFKKFNIENEMVLTSDRREYKFDQEFEAYNFLNDFLFYFPGTDKYLEPSNFGTRYGYPMAYLMDNYGLFVEEMTVGDFSSAVASIKYIEPISYKTTTDTMLIDVKFDPEDFTVTKIQLDEAVTGYNAQAIQPYLNFIDKDRLDDILDQFGKIIDEDSEVNNRELVYKDPELFDIKPFQLKFDLTSESFVTKAGKKYLFKLGDLIGPQVEMYQEKERVLPYEEGYQRTYVRTITVHIPEGYKVANLDDINIKNEYVEDGEEIFKFHSYYSLEGNVLTVNADEHYQRNIVSPELYEEYRTVINSAADFNKITLVLEPK